MCLGHLVVEPNPKVGEHWYVKYWNAGAVMEVLVKSKSLRTIELESTQFKYGRPTSSRYTLGDVEFIERTKEAL